MRYFCKHQTYLFNTKRSLQKSDFMNLLKKLCNLVHTFYILRLNESDIKMIGITSILEKPDFPFCMATPTFAFYRIVFTLLNGNIQRSTSTTLSFSKKTLGFKSIPHPIYLEISSWSSELKNANLCKRTEISKMNFKVPISCN